MKNININIDLDDLIKHETEILQDVIEAKYCRSILKYAKLINKDDLEKSSDKFFQGVMEDIKRFLIQNGYVTEFEYCSDCIQQWYLNRLQLFFKLKKERCTLVQILKFDAPNVAEKILSTSLYAANHDKLTDKIYENKKKEYLGE